MRDPDDESVVVLHVNALTAIAVARVLIRCPRCRSRTRHVARLYEWYDPETTCCACASMSPGRDRLLIARQKARRVALRAEWQRALPLRAAAAKASRAVIRGLKVTKEKPHDD